MVEVSAPKGPALSREMHRFGCYQKTALKMLLDFWRNVLSSGPYPNKPLSCVEMEQDLGLCCCLSLSLCSCENRGLQGLMLGRLRWEWDLVPVAVDSEHS